MKEKRKEERKRKRKKSKGKERKRLKSELARLVSYNTQPTRGCQLVLWKVPKDTPFSNIIKCLKQTKHGSSSLHEARGAATIKFIVTARGCERQIFKK